MCYRKKGILLIALPVHTSHHVFVLHVPLRPSWCACWHPLQALVLREQDVHGGQQHFRQVVSYLRDAENMQWRWNRRSESKILSFLRHPGVPTLIPPRRWSSWKRRLSPLRCPGWAGEALNAPSPERRRERERETAFPWRTCLCIFVPLFFTHVVRSVHMACVVLVKESHQV